MEEGVGLHKGECGILAHAVGESGDLVGLGDVGKVELVELIDVGEEIAHLLGEALLLTRGEGDAGETGNVADVGGGEAHGG